MAGRRSVIRQRQGRHADAQHRAIPRAAPLSAGGHRLLDASAVLVRICAIRTPPTWPTRKSVSPFELKTLLGHKSIATSQRYVDGARAGNPNRRGHNPLYERLRRKTASPNGATPLAGPRGQLGECCSPTAVPAADVELESSRRSLSRRPTGTSPALRNHLAEPLGDVGDQARTSGSMTN